LNKIQAIDILEIQFKLLLLLLLSVLKMTSVAVNSYDMPLIPSGKYAGQPATVLFDDPSTLNWLKLQPWFEKKSEWRPIYNLIVHQSLVQPGADSKTPEHNQLQNIFFDPNIQRRLIKRMFRDHLNKITDSINKLIKNPEFIESFGIHDEHTVDDLLAQSDIKIRVEAEAKFNWDVVIRFDACCMYFYSLKEIEENCKKTYLKTHNLENYEEEQRLLYETEKNAYEQKIAELDNDSSAKTNGTDVRSFFSGGTSNTGGKSNPGASSNNYFKKQTLTSCFNEYDKRYKATICDFNKKYITHRKKYFNDLLSKYFKESSFEINYLSSDCTHVIWFKIFALDHNIYCELKPSLGDDYPCVLRKMRAQIEPILKQDEINRKDSEYEIAKKHFLLILGRFSAKYTDIALLRQMFDPKTIAILFTDELLDDLPKAPTIENTGNYASRGVKESTPDISVLLTEVSLLKSQLADAQGIIAKTQQENDALKEQIAKLQKPTTKKPAQKDAKSITEYFKK
jgi:hypothetical protein